ncbi:nuclear protein export protein Yrb2 [Cordyceps javanica]|uniref:Nuclear protein export protein Yrb2 n=1 Tax=Cordyceps javanica TaxID=43265 RepID=A0A545V4M6_9HYPO|nr:nuclear protein export protein Yrb2 [Cordyceps javanica]TQW07921.1 nuclear protein export protein Yrb2 [Cordyceps javanica]
MAEEIKAASPRDDTPQTSAAEDADTRAARRELKQHSISDPVGGSVSDDADRPETPVDDDVADERNNELKEQLASPKKKRGHDQLDPAKDDKPTDTDSVASADSAKDRASRSEPEKKRHRDTDGDVAGADEVTFAPYDNDLSRRLTNLVQTTSDKDEPKTELEPEAKTGTAEAKPGPDKKDPPQTSASAFAASGFGKLAAGSSPFAGLGGNAGSAFGSAGKKSLTSFASTPKNTEAQPLAPAPTLSFGGAASAASPFATGPSRTNGFGSGLGGSGFASASGAKPLSSFASGKPKPFQTQKSAKPFGAPDSDADDDEEEENGEEEEGNSAAEKDRDASSEKEDDKSKVKLHKVDVDDGEAGEATILSVRAKMFVHENDAWKERGAGMLKINAPKSCVEFDDNNVVVPGSFDASGLDEEEGDEATAKVVRLLMRQDQTHRIILNTAIISAMKFQEKTSLKSTSVLFTAFVGDSATPLLVTMRMSAANAKLFQSEVESIQRELQNR